MAAELETGWNLETKSRRDKCSSELRIARPKVLIASPPCRLFLKLQNHNDGRSNALESGESKVITTRYHVMFVRECFEQMHRGDHFIFEHLTEASSWNELCVRKLIAQPSFFGVEGPMCRWHLLSGESGFVREPVSSLTNHRDLADSLEQSSSGVKAFLESSLTGTRK